MFARVRTHNPRFAHRQVPDVGGELRIFTDSETAFIAFGDYINMAKALATNFEPKDLNKRLSVVKIPSCPKKVRYPFFTGDKFALSSQNMFQPRDILLHLPDFLMNSFRC